MAFKIESDGTMEGTRLVDGAGNAVPGVKRITWNLNDETKLAIAVVEISGVELVAKVEKEKTFIKEKKENK